MTSRICDFLSRRFRAGWWCVGLAVVALLATHASSSSAASLRYGGHVTTFSRWMDASRIELPAVDIRVRVRNAPCGNPDYLGCVVAGGGIELRGGSCWRDWSPCQQTFYYELAGVVEQHSSDELRERFAAIFGLAGTDYDAPIGGTPDTLRARFAEVVGLCAQRPTLAGVVAQYLRHARQFDIAYFAQPLTARQYRRTCQLVNAPQAADEGGE